MRQWVISEGFGAKTDAAEIVARYPRPVETDFGRLAERTITRRCFLEGSVTGIIDAILETERDLDVPRKQRHTAYRIFERLRSSPLAR